MVEGVSVLLYKSFDLQEGGQEIPFVSGSIDWISQGLVVVKGIEGGIEAVYLVAFPLRFLCLDGLRFSFILGYGRLRRRRFSRLRPS